MWIYIPVAYERRDCCRGWNILAELWCPFPAIDRRSSCICTTQTPKMTGTKFLFLPTFWIWVCFWLNRLLHCWEGPIQQSSERTLRNSPRCERSQSTQVNSGVSTFHETDAYNSILSRLTRVISEEIFKLSFFLKAGTRFCSFKISFWQPFLTRLWYVFCVNDAG